MKVVVGLDTSPAATEALRWAARFARAVGADLHAVHAYIGPQKEAVPLPRDPRPPGQAAAGTGEHVGLGRLLVGSVSHSCHRRSMTGSNRLTHAKCPVVAVPAPQLIEEAGLNDDHVAPSADPR
jgi:hypothetical protein